VVISFTFIIGSALAAVAGLMVAANYSIKAHYYMGFMLGLKAFTAAVLGGIGNLGGAMPAVFCWASSKARRRLHRRSDRWLSRQPLSGHVRFLRADPGAGVPALPA
jgi:ABC-type branched-subunit amino acid transport system permease subunit